MITVNPLRLRLSVFIILVLQVISILSLANAEALHAPKRVIIVYYFHRTIRCPSCTLLENMTREAVVYGFEKELNSGRVKIAVINVDLKANEHFITDYNIDAQSVIVSEMVNGKEKRWKNLDQAWTLLGDEGRLWQYLLGEIESYLNH